LAAQTCYSWFVTAATALENWLWHWTCMNFHAMSRVKAFAGNILMRMPTRSKDIFAGGLSLPASNE
jgi:hypothetical protein